MHRHADSVESMEQLAMVWRTMVLDRDPGADVRDLPGIAVRWADCRFAFWNCLTLTDVGADAGLVKQRLGEAAEVMRTKRRPGFLWIFEDLLDEQARAGLDEAADAAGLAYAFPGTGMAADLPSLPEPAHDELTFKRVTDDELLRAYADLNSRAYGFPWRTVATAWPAPRCGRATSTPTWDCATASPSPAPPRWRPTDASSSSWSPPTRTANAAATGRR